MKTNHRKGNCCIVQHENYYYYYTSGMQSTKLTHFLFDVKIYQNIFRLVTCPGYGQGICSGQMSSLLRCTTTSRTKLLHSIGKRLLLRLLQTSTSSTHQSKTLCHDVPWKKPICKCFTTISILNQLEWYFRKACVLSTTQIFQGRRPENKLGVPKFC